MTQEMFLQKASNEFETRKREFTPERRLMPYRIAVYGSQLSGSEVEHIRLTWSVMLHQ